MKITDIPISKLGAYTDLKQKLQSRRTLEDLRLSEKSQLNRSLKSN